MEAPNNARRLRDALRRLVLAHGTLKEATRPCGARLSLPHAYALLELLDAEPMTVSELSSRLAIDRTNVSRLCARMERSGEMTRGAHPEDGRAVVVALSARGRALAKSVDESSTAHFATLAGALKGQTESIIGALEVLANAMNEEQEE
ncbi:MAG: MarR family winged helix-turn-helix transcriptional regulator [Polyangiales bacterium]